jgi:hypothetical protein
MTVYIVSYRKEIGKVWVNEGVAQSNKVAISAANNIVGMGYADIVIVNEIELSGKGMSSPPWKECFRWMKSNWD